MAWFNIDNRHRDRKFPSRIETLVVVMPSVTGLLFAFSSSFFAAILLSDSSMLSEHYYVKIDACGTSLVHYVLPWVQKRYAICSISLLAALLYIASIINVVLMSMQLTPVNYAMPEKENMGENDFTQYSNNKVNNIKEAEICAARYFYFGLLLTGLSVLLLLNNYFLLIALAMYLFHIRHAVTLWFDNKNQSSKSSE